MRAGAPSPQSTREAPTPRLTLRGVAGLQWPSSSEPPASRCAPRRAGNRDGTRAKPAGGAWPRGRGAGRPPSPGLPSRPRLCTPRLPAREGAATWRRARGPRGTGSGPRLASLLSAATSNFFPGTNRCTISPGPSAPRVPPADPRAACALPCSALLIEPSAAVGLCGPGALGRGPESGNDSSDEFETTGQKK